MGGAGRKSPTCVEIASLLRNTKLFALEPEGWLFAVSCWLCAEQKVVCVLVASGQKKKRGKKKGRDDFLGGLCSGDVFGREKRDLFPAAGQGSGSKGIIQPQVVEEKSSAPQDLRSEALATGRLRFRLPDHREVCAGRELWFTHRHIDLLCVPVPSPGEPREVPCPAREDARRTGGCKKDRWTQPMPALHRSKLKLSLAAPSMSRWGIPARGSLISSVGPALIFILEGKITGNNASSL